MRIDIQGEPEHQLRGARRYPAAVWSASGARRRRRSQQFLRSSQILKTSSCLMNTRLDHEHVQRQGLVQRCSPSFPVLWTTEMLCGLPRSTSRRRRRIYDQIGLVYGFSEEPHGHYKLNLADHYQRLVAVRCPEYLMTKLAWRGRERRRANRKL